MLLRSAEYTHTLAQPRSSACSSRYAVPPHGNLEKWAHQGVLLLNAGERRERGQGSRAAWRLRRAGLMPLLPSLSSQLRTTWWSPSHRIPVAPLAVLTVRANTAASHAKKGWEAFTDAAIGALSERRTGVVFLLWGKYAEQKGKVRWAVRCVCAAAAAGAGALMQRLQSRPLPTLPPPLSCSLASQVIDRSRHHILTAPHPSGLSAHRGFFGCRHFSKTNQLLVSEGGSQRGSCAADGGWMLAGLALATTRRVVSTACRPTPALSPVLPSSGGLGEAAHRLVHRPLTIQHSRQHCTHRPVLQGGAAAPPLRPQRGHPCPHCILTHHYSAAI